jgi:RNA polymerase sigma factor (sigma-70 family)
LFRPGGLLGWSGHASCQGKGPTIDPETCSNEVELLARWRAGDQHAAAQLFRRYADRLIALARTRLSARLAQRVDPEDVVQSAYRSFFAEAITGRYEGQRGNDLWRLLVTITLHKLQHQVERHTAKKRAVEREQTFGSEDSLLGIQPDVLARDAAPMDALALVEEVEMLMRGLTPSHRRIVELRLQGYNQLEIADATACSQRTVIRVLERIKQQLELRRSGNS